MKHRPSLRWILTAVLIAGATLAPAQGQEATPANGNLQARVAAAMTTVSPPVAEDERTYGQGIAASVLEAYVQNSQRAFNVTAAEIVYLHDRGIPDSITTAMIQHQAAARQQAGQAGAPEPAPNSAYAPAVPPATAYPYPPQTIYPDYAYADYPSYPYGFYAGYPFWFPFSFGVSFESFSPFFGPFCSPFFRPFCSPFFRPFCSPFFRPFCSPFFGPFCSPFLRPFCSPFFRPFVSSGTRVPIFHHTGLTVSPVHARITSGLAPRSGGSFVAAPTHLAPRV